MFKALMGGNRSSSDLASTSSSKSSRRRKNDSKSTVSRKSSRGDDRERGLGDLTAYSPSGSRRYRGDGESIASTVDPELLLESDRVVIERASKRRSDDGRRERYRDGDRDSRSARRRDRDRSSRDYESRSRALDDLDDSDRERDGSRRERRRTQPRDPNLPPLNTDIPTSGTGAHFAADIAAPGFSQFPMQYDNMIPGSTTPEQAGSPAVYDPHVQQQFPGQFPAVVAEPYRPPNPAGEAADYYGDQGQSVAEQPGVRPKPPAVIPNSQAHLMPASPSANPPPEPSSVGQVGAAAAYYTDDADHQASPQPGRPPEPSHQPQSTNMLGSAAAAGAATYGVGSGLHGNADSSAHPAGPIEPSNIMYTQPAPTSPHKPPHSHNMGAAVGAAAATAAAGYMIGHHHHSSSSPEHLTQYGIQNYEYPSHGVSPMHGPNTNPALFNAGAAGYGAAAAHGMHSHGGPVSHGPPFQSGGLAFQQRQRGPLDKLVDFWRDPEGVGMFEDYTESIGLCRYCFEPGTSSLDAPRKHHYNRRRRSWDRLGSGSRVEKLSRFPSSEEEGRRRRKSKAKSWLPGLLAGYAAKSLFSKKGFDDTYSVKSGRVVSPRQSLDDGESISTLDRKSQSSRGAYRRSNRSRSRDRYDNSSYSDLKSSKYGSRRTRSRSRSRSSSRSGRHSGLRDAALGAAVGSAAMAMSRSRRRSRSPKKAKSRKGSSSSGSSYSDVSNPGRKSVAGGLTSFFTTPSENRKKRPSKKSRGFFSFNNSSSSSLDADLAFGSGYAKRESRKSKKKADRDRDVDARLMGLGAAATALAASSHRHNRRTGEIFAAKDSRSRHYGYTPSATNDDGWEDLDSADQSSSSVSSALAFGGDDSQTSDSGTSKWGWRWGSKKDKKQRKSDPPGGRHHTGAAVAAGALGGAALASAYHHSHSTPHSHDDESGTGSLQPVFPMPTSDPSQFDAVRVPPGGQPTLVRPGPIPLQQPQPVTPVSHAVYTTQGEPTYYAALSEPPVIGNVYTGYAPPYQDSKSEYMSQRDLGYRKPHQRSDSSPVFGTEPFEDVPASSLKRRSTMKDQASVQFDLTEEQMRKERRANRRERERQDIRYDEGPQLIDREHELALQDAEREERRRRDREDEVQWKDDYDDRSSRLSRRRTEPEDRERRRRDGGKETDSSSWVGAAAAGTVGAAAAASVLSGKRSHDDSSEVSQGRYSERREKRRAERRRADPQTATTISEGVQDIDDTSPIGLPNGRAGQSELDRVSKRTPNRDDYAQFFAPEGLRYSPDNHTLDQSVPEIVEIEPANERFSREMSQFSEASHSKRDTLPWPIPRLNFIEPTPPQSINGSVRSGASPTAVPADRSHENAKRAEKQKSGSRVSWGEHETHEYEAQSTSPEHDSFDLDGARELERSKRDASQAEGAGYGADVEFAATVAAATAAAGFDPSLVTDDPTYHTRGSPPWSETKDTFSPSQYGPDFRRSEPHGFVEGEVETSGREGKAKQPMAEGSNEQSWEVKPGVQHFIEGEPIYSEPEAFAKERDAPAMDEKVSSSEPEIIEHPSEREKSDTEPHFDSANSFSMPGGFELDDSPRELKDREYFDARKDDNRSVFSAPVAGEFETVPRPKKSRQSTDGFEELRDYAAEPADAEGTEEKKKRRKRRSKRHSDNFDDAASVTSSPAKIEAVSEKRGSKDENEKGKGSVGFFSSIFGSRVSEPADPKRSSSIDGRSREVKSEIGTAGREPSSRRKKRSSRHRSSGSMDVLDDPGQLEDRDSDQESSKPGEPDDVNIENYKSHRQRREDRRRHRYEEMVGSGKGTDFEKDREDDDNADRQSFLARGPEMLDDHESGASGHASAMAAGAAGIGLGMMGEHFRNRSASPTAGQAPRQQSRPASPEFALDELAQGQRSRRSSMLTMNDSPTAVPLYFRRPPISPGANRPSSVSSPAAPQPESPSQSRHRRPASTEFKNSREFRPLWLVERHGGKVEPQPDEPLPSLPSSKPSSRSPSMEDLKGSADDQEVRRWEAVDLSHHVHDGRRSPGLRISTERDDYADAEHDVLGSQQATPTAQSFGQADQSVKKEKPKYEFHSPSELLQDPGVYAELPPSPTFGALPSAEGSAVGVPEESVSEDALERYLDSLPPLPDSRPPTPQEQQQPPISVAETTPAQTREESTGAADIAKGIGFAGIVDAAVSAAVKGTEKVSSREVSEERGYTESKDEAVGPDMITREIEPPATEQNIPQDLEVAPQSRELPETFTQSSPGQQTGPAGFAGVVDAAVAVAAESKDDKEPEPADTVQLGHAQEPKGEPSAELEEKPDPEELPSADKEVPEDIQGPTERADKPSDETPQTPVDEPASVSSSKKKKKNKKKKAQSMDLTEPESTPASPAPEDDAKPDEPATEQVPAPDTAETQNVPGGFEDSRELEPEASQLEKAQPEEAHLEAAPAADAEEPPAPEASSKKAKRDKKKKRKSKGLDLEEQPEQPEAEQPATGAVTEHESSQPTEEPETSGTTIAIPGEDASKEREESITTTRDTPTEPIEDRVGASEEPIQSTEQDHAATPEETKELDVEHPESGAEPEHDKNETQAHAQEPDQPNAPVEWQDAPELPDTRELPVESGQQITPEVTEKETTEVPAEQATVVPDTEQSQPEFQQEMTQEAPAPAEDSAPTDVAPEPPAQDQGTPAADQEPDPGISRKASKKNKKKNKRKNTAEAPVESEATETKEPPTSGETLEGQIEPTETAEAGPESGEPELQQNEAEENAEDPQKQDDPAQEPVIDGQPDSTTTDTLPGRVEQAQEVSAVEDWEEQPKKKGKKGKKSRKSLSLSEAQAEPEPELKSEQSEFVDAPESQPTQAGDEAFAVDESQPPPEANDEETPATEGAEPAAAGTEVEPTSLDKQPESEVDTLGVPEQPSTAEGLPADVEVEPTSLGKQPESEADTPGVSEQPSTAEELPADMEAKDVPVESEAPKHLAVETPESQAPPEIETPLTPAQKKKAKKDKKKKRQSALVEETSVPQPAGESAQNEATPDGDVAVAGESAAVQGSEKATSGDDSATIPAEHAEEAPKDNEPTDNSAAGVDKDITATAEETSRGEPADDVTAAVAPTGEEQGAEEAPAKEESKDTATGVLEDAVDSTATDADLAQQEPRDDTGTAAEATATDEKKEVTAEPEPQTDETATPVGTTEEQSPGDGIGVEDSQELTKEDATADTAQEQDKAQTEDAEPTTSKKSKKDKKKKKKRQSLTPEDEATEQIVPSGEAEAVDPAYEAAVGNETEKSEEVPTEEAMAETTPAEPPAPEPTEEFQSAASKRKAKKDKKKRKSVSFDIEEPVGQPADPNETAETTVTPQADEAKPEHTSEPHTASPEAVESAELEKEAQQSVDSPKEDPSAAAHEQGESNEMAESAPAEDQAANISLDPTAEEVPETHDAAATSELQTQPPAGEMADAEVPVSEPEKTDVTETVPEAEIKDAEAVTSEEPSAPEPQSPQPDDTEQDAGTSKSKKDKKKKKKRKTLELTEEPAIASEPVSDAQPEPDRAADPETTDVKEPEEPAPQPEKEEEDGKPFMSAKEKRKAKKDKKRQSKLLDLENDGQDAASSAPGASPEEPKDPSTPVESAPADDASQDVIPTLPTEAEPSEPSPATIVPPAEDDGKANQSHDTQTSGEKEKDRIWTDEMVSLQVEQQQEASAVFPSQPEPEHTVADQSLVPSGTEPDISGPDIENKEGPPTTPNEPEAPADEGETADEKIFADVSETTNEKETGLVPTKGVEEVESKHGQTDGLPESDNIPSAPTEETAEQPATEEALGDVVKENDSPATPAAGTEIPFEADSPNPEVPPVPEAEELAATTSSKKKKDKKQKQKEKQLGKNQLAEPTPSAEQQQSDMPQEPVTAPEERALESGQMNEEPVVGALGVEASEEPVKPTEEPALEAGHKDDEPVAGPMDIEAPKEPAIASEEDVKERYEEGDEPTPEPTAGIESPDEHAVSSQNVTASIEENVESPGLSRKMSKKEKKKRRSLAQDTADQAQTEEQPAVEADTTVSSALDNPTIPPPSESQEDKLPVDADGNEAIPEEQESSTIDAPEPQPESIAPVESTNDHVGNLEIGDSHAPGDAHIREQPTAAGDAGKSLMEIVEEQSRSEPGADGASREIQDQPEDPWMPTSKKKAKKNKKKALAQEALMEDHPQIEAPSATSEPTINVAESAEKPTTDIQSSENVPEQLTEEKHEDAEDDWATSPKKKGKKAKKEKQKAKAQQEEIPSPVETQDNAPAEGGSARAHEPTAPIAEDVGIAPEEQAWEREQTQQGEPSVSLDPFEVPLESEAMDVDMPMEPTGESGARELPENDLQDESVSKNAQEKQKAQELEKNDDLEVAEDLFEDRPKELGDVAPLPRKLSKKEKRKSKQKALQGAIEPAQQAEPEVSMESEAAPQTEEDQPPSAIEQTMDDAPLSRSSSKKKKKAKRVSQLVEPEQPEQPEQVEAKELAINPTEHAPVTDLQTLERQGSQQDEEAWPSIDWGKDRAENLPEQTPEPLSESRQIAIEPGSDAIGEFDESAIPWAVAKESEQPPADGTWTVPSKKKDKKKRRSQPREAEPVPMPTSEPVQETERTISEGPNDMHQETPLKQGKLANIFPGLERGSFRRPATKAASQSGKVDAEDETIDQGAQVSEAPITTIEDSEDAAGTWPTPDNRGFGERRSISTVLDPFTERPTTRELDAPAADPSYSEFGLSDGLRDAAKSAEVRLKDNNYGNTPSPANRPASDPTTPSNPFCSLRRSPSIHGKHNHPQRPWSLDETTIPTAREATAPQSLFGGPIETDNNTVSPPRTPLGTIAEQEPESHVGKAGGGTMAPSSGTPQLEVKPEHLLPHPQTPVRKFTDNALDRQRWPTPDKEVSSGMEDGGDDEIDGMQKRRKPSPETSRSDREIPAGPILKPSSSSEKRSLRRTMRSGSGDLRAASRAQETTDPQPPLPAPDRTIERIASSSSYDPVTDKGKRPVRGMTDVFEAWGETPTSPRSPSRPPSVRHRRSMQHLQDLETRLDQLISENRLLAAAREEAEGKLKTASVARRKSDHALNTRGADLRDKEAEVEQLRSSVEWLQKEVGRLTEENEGLTTTNTSVAAAHAQQLLVARQSSTRDLDDLRSQYQQLSDSVEDRVRHEVDTALALKNAEIRRLQEELEATRQKVRELQQQIAASMQDDVLVFRDEDYFDGACQRLCGHVQQWVLRFSKHSDHHRCRKLADLQDEKIADRFDNAILDGSDADSYLADRVRRRDVFMSVVMTMIWEYIFTRYLFGMDRDQRQKLKSLEKHLVEVGTRSAVHRWRATTLTLLSKRAAFSKQRESDTEAVALEVFGVLSRLLPPPTHVEGPLLDSLRKVLRVAVNLSLEMRTQLAEYIMLPPLQPEYDTNGDLARHVYFNASLMNERSGETTSNEELETRQSVVRIVLFPLVVKKGNDTGDGEDEVVVCPAQVLVARSSKDKSTMSLHANRSAHSIAPPSTMDMSNVV